MKLKIFFIIFINLLSNSNVVLIDILYTPIGKNGSKVFDSNDGIILFLDLSNFQINDDIFYYFEFNETDALDDNEESLITFYESHIYEINQEENIISKYIDSSYIKTYQKKSTRLSRTRFFFSSSKENETNYLLIGLISNHTKYQFKFRNTEIDLSSMINENLDISIIVMIILFFAICLENLITIIVLQNCKKKKEYETGNLQNVNIQQGQYVHQIQYSQQRQYPQQIQYSQQGPYYQQIQYNQQGPYYQQIQYRQQVPYFQ